MIIKDLTLTNFRSYNKKKFSFHPFLTLVVGPNASGKTNLLEAIFLLSTGKSFKAERDMEMVRFSQEVGRVEGTIEQCDNLPALPVQVGGKAGVTMKQFHNEETNGKNSELIELEAVITRGEVMGVKTPIKKHSINGVGKRMLDFVGRLKTVLFWPEDLELVTDSPSLRRRYLDFVLMQVDREYRRTLISYEKGLRQRNRLLEAIRDEGARRHQLIFWDQLLIKNGEYITRKREEYISYVNNFQFPISNFQSISNFQFSNYKLEYDKSIISRQRLDQYSKEEIAAGVTLVGPHRDDMIFKIQNPKSLPGRLPAQAGQAGKIQNNDWRQLSLFGSRGEQRLAILWLKLCELAYIEQASGEKPVLLLDDILSELDHEHRRIIFDVIGNQQTVVTTTDVHFIEKDIFKKAQIIEL